MVMKVPSQLKRGITLANEPGNALQFDGVDDYGFSMNGSLPQGNSPRSIEAWVKTVSGAVMDIVSWGTAVSNSRASLIVHGGVVKYVPTIQRMTGTIPVNDGDWHHVASIFDGTTLSIYVDGVLDVFGAMTFATAGTELLLARSPMDHGFDEIFDGQIDEVRIGTGRFR